MKKVFLHGLDSSGDGTKGRFFKNNFPEMIVPNFEGSLEKRLQELEKICQGDNGLILVGSSFGGLMAACFAAMHPLRIKKLLLMAPALNFPGFILPKNPIEAPVFMLVGSLDEVTPASMVIPIAKKAFVHLEIKLVDEDHLLHESFQQLDWAALLEERKS